MNGFEAFSTSWRSCRSDPVLRRHRRRAVGALHPVVDGRLEAQGALALLHLAGVAAALAAVAAQLVVAQRGARRRRRRRREGRVGGARAVEVLGLRGAGATPAALAGGRSGGGGAARGHVVGAVEAGGGRRGAGTLLEPLLHGAQQAAHGGGVAGAGQLDAHERARAVLAVDERVGVGAGAQAEDVLGHVAGAAEAPGAQRRVGLEARPGVGAGAAARGVPGEGAQHVGLVVARGPRVGGRGREADAGALEGRHGGGGGGGVVRG